MSGPARYDVVLVCAKANLGWATQLAVRLEGESEGFRVALETYLPGALVVARLQELIQSSANCVFVFSHAAESDPLKQQTYAALIRSSEFGWRFIPVLLEDVLLPPLGVGYAPADFRGEDQETPYQALLQALRGDRSVGDDPLGPYMTSRLEDRREVLLRIEREQVSMESGGRSVHSQPAAQSFALEQDLWELGRARSGHPGEVLTNVGVDGNPAASLQERLHQVGTVLGETFLTGAVGEALAAVFAEAASHHDVLQLALQLSVELSGLPWETMILPGHSEPLALQPGVQLYRYLPTAARLPPIAIKAPLRILAVMAAPDGPGSGPVLDLEKELQLILASIEDTRRHAGAYVKILNEGNLESITQALEEERFHVLHVSCHAGPGVLLLEAADGGIDAVTPGRLAAAIPRGRGVPLVVLSGCSTALDIQAEGSRGKQAGLADQTELSGLARSLSAAGVPAVLAMTATVTDRYATALASALYRQLALREAPEALTALSRARCVLEEQRRISGDAFRPEWATPVLFLRGPSLPLYHLSQGIDTDVRPPSAVHLDPSVAVRGVGDFVGRRAELRAMQSALRHGMRGVLLHGIGGVGKSSLVAELIGRLGGLVASVMGRTSPDQILIAVADQLLSATAQSGPDSDPVRNLAMFLRELNNPWSVRLGTLAELFDQTPVTLLLDNFEDNLDLGTDLNFVDAELPAFLTAWIQAAGRGRILVTSRYPFALPGDAHLQLHVQHVGPLSLAETTKLMWRLPRLDALSPEDRQLAWADVGGHPRTLEYLDALLSGGQARFPDVKRRLEGLLYARESGPDPVIYLRADGNLDAALAEAVTLAVDDVLLHDLLGLLDDFTRDVLVGASVYRIPVDRTGIIWPVSTPAEPDHARDERIERIVEQLSLAHADNPEATVEDLGLPPEELEQTLQDIASWQAAPIAEPAGADAAIGMLLRLGLLSSADTEASRGFVVHRWTAKTLARHDFSAPDRLTAAHRSAASFWQWQVDLRSLDPQQELQALLEAQFHWRAAGDVTEAAGTNDVICGMLHTAGAWGWEEQLHREALSWFPAGSHGEGATYHQLGMIAEARGEYEQALDLYRQSLAIAEELGDRASIAASYHELGNVAVRRSDYDQARDWYQKSLPIFEELGQRADVGGSYHQLGMIADQLSDYNRALDWYRKSLTIAEELGDRASAAISYHMLGQTAQKQHDYDEAVKWYGKSIPIFEELGHRANVAMSYHNLGLLAEDRREYEKAVDWYRKSLTINEELGNLAGAAVNYGQLGMIASIRDDHDQALGWYRKSLAVAEELGDRSEIAICYHQFGIIARKMGDYNQAIDWYEQSLGIFEELGDRFHVAMNYMQLGNVYAKAGQAAQSTSCTAQSLFIFFELGMANPSQNMNWLPGQREALGGARFRQILAEYLDPDNVAAIIADLDSPNRTAAES